MKIKTESKLETIRKKWNEARVCAALLQQGRASIVIGRRKDGSTYKYTNPQI